MFYVNRICTASTVAEYKLYASGLEEICKRNKCFKWYNWWKARHFHLVPALRGFGWTGTNWAEIGHSMMKKNRKVWLSVAAAEDIADMIVQENIYLSFIKNEGKTIGKGPTAFTKKMNERKAERHYVDSVVESLRTTDMMDEVEKHKDPDAMFMPSRKAKHSIPKIFSTKNPLEREKMPVRTANAKMRNVNRKQRIEKYSSEEEEDNDTDVEDLSSSDLGDHQQQATMRMNKSTQLMMTSMMMVLMMVLMMVKLKCCHHHKLSRRKYSLTGKIEAKTGNTSTSIICLHQKKKEIQAMKTARNQTEGSYRRKLSKGKWQLIHLHM